MRLSQHRSSVIETETKELPLSACLDDFELQRPRRLLEFRWKTIRDGVRYAGSEKVPRHFTVIQGLERP